MCPNATFVHKNSLCFMQNIIFQLLSCLYHYDSGIPVPVCIRKQSLYTDFWQLALVHRAVGIPTSGACVNILCRRYTDFWRRREVCAKSVYRLLAFKELTSCPSITVIIIFLLIVIISYDNIQFLDAYISSTWSPLTVGHVNL